MNTVREPEYYIEDPLAAGLHLLKDLPQSQGRLSVGLILKCFEAEPAVLSEESYDVFVEVVKERGGSL
jgi:hypothetical protein